MSLHRMIGDPQFTAPVVIAAFDGWIDSAGAATACANHLGAHGEVVVKFDSDELIDYRARRPVLDVVDGTLTNLSWPEITIRRSTFDGRDVLVLVGPEPDYQWRAFATDVLDLCLRLGVTEWITLGAIPAAVPHTRSVPVFATASMDGLLRHGEEKGPGGLLRVPSAALSVVELTIAGAGVPAVGYFAQIPHYVGGAYTPGTIALVEHLERHLGISVPLGELPDEALAQRGRLDAAVEADPGTREYVEQLESAQGDERMPSGDELASEIERFLRTQQGGPAGEDPTSR